MMTRKTAEELDRVDNDLLALAADLKQILQSDEQRAELDKMIAEIRNLKKSVKTSLTTITE